jgi:fluoroacetyl-CoA thioesterase
MLAPGITLEQKHAVTEAETITFLGGDVPPSLATPAMISRLEFACRDAVLPNLESGQDTVGTRVSVEHLAATPLGKAVTYLAKLTAVDGRRLMFEVEAREGGELIGRGTHERFVIDVARFAAGLKKRFGAGKP